jgi:hypothetical protein
VAESCLPAAAKLKIAHERRHRTHHQVVEVDLAVCRHQRRVGIHRRHRLGGRRPTLDLPRRDERVERGRIGWLGWASVTVRVDSPVGEHWPTRGAQQREAVGEQPDRAPTIQEHLPRQGVERPDLDRIGSGDVRGQPAGDAGRKLGGSAAVERNDPDPIGGNAARQEHAEARDQGRRLAAAGRGDDLGRLVGQRRGRPLEEKTTIAVQPIPVGPVNSTTGRI